MFSFSVCLISKNEEKNIEQCLSALKPLTNYFPGSEVVLVDTGSEDRTCELAEKNGAKVFHRPWDGNFSAARNFASDQAQNNLILAVDCDEFLISCSNETAVNFEKSVRANNNFLGMSTIISKYEQGGEVLDSKAQIGRFYDKRYYKFYGDIHENIRLINNPGNVRGYFDLPLCFRHVGYDSPELRAKKAARNKDLLLKELEQNPADPYILFQIGKCYAAMQDKESASKYYEQALELPLNPDYSYVQDMIISYGYCLLDQKRFKDALGLEAVSQDLKNNGDFMFLLGLIHMNNAMFDLAIQDFLVATHATNYSVEGVNSFKSFYNIGVIYEVSGSKNKALEYYRKCRGYSPAIERLSALSYKH